MGKTFPTLGSPSLKGARATADKRSVIQRPIHALDPFGGKLAALCRARVSITSEVSKDPSKVTCESCQDAVKCPACGWPIPISAAAALAKGRRYHTACALKLELDSPSSTTG